MRFDKHRRPPPYLSRRDQYRMLGLVAALGLVLLAIQWAADPQNWTWLAGADAPSGESTEVEEPPSLEDVEFRAVSPDDGPLPPGVFRAEFAAESTDETETLDEQHPTRLPPDLLADIRDDQLGALRREQPAIEFLLGRVRELDLQTLESAATDGVAFPVLMVRTDEYRGELITVEGTLRRLQPLQGPRETPDGVYEGWMFSPTSDNNPYRILVTELPPGMPPGTDLEIPVQFTGYFVKRYGYLSQGGQHVAPMLIGKTFRLLPRASAPADDIGDDLSRYALGFLLFVGCAFGLLLWRFVVSDRRFRNSRMQQLAESRLDARDEDIDALADIDVVDPDRMFENREEG